MTQYTGDFFQGRLSVLIDPTRELAVLSTLIAWTQLEATLAPLLQKKQRPTTVALDTRSGLLFEPEVLAPISTAVSAAGRPRLPIGLMCALLILKHLHNLSDQALCERWTENIYWQYFSGEEIYAPK